jgi:hypothetical protein
MNETRETEPMAVVEDVCYELRHVQMGALAEKLESAIRQLISDRDALKAERDGLGELLKRVQEKAERGLAEPDATAELVEICTIIDAAMSS